MSKKYLLTGAAGFLGGHILRLLLNRGENVRVLTLPGDPLASSLPGGIELLEGDVRNPDDLRRFFDVPQGVDVTVIHTAAIVTIWPGYNQTVYDVNVGGVKNIVAKCIEKKVKKLVYVCSVHGLTEPPMGQTIREQTDFDPDSIVGFYGKTKAEAAQFVTDAVRHDGLDASIVFPSGICGPGDLACGHVTQLLKDCSMGRLAAGVRGGYDFVDVRDVAQGVVAAADKGGPGENYILSNRRVSVEEILRLVHEQTGAKEVKTMLPLWVAEAAVPLLSPYYRLKKQKPLYTKYSLHVLVSNCDFDCEKARRELGYSPRPFQETVADSIEWMKSERMITEKQPRRPRRVARRKGRVL